jgi:hypothetical protein
VTYIDLYEFEYSQTPQQQLDSETVSSTKLSSNPPLKNSAPNFSIQSSSNTIRTKLTKLHEYDCIQRCVSASVNSNKRYRFIACYLFLLLLLLLLLLESFK